MATLIKKKKATLTNATTTNKPATKTAKGLDPKKLDAKNAQTVKQEVVSLREVKYKYPADVVGALAKKSWRQKTRNHMQSLESKVLNAKDGAEKTKATKELADFKKEVLLAS